jgi:hypothetical protein
MEDTRFHQVGQELGPFWLGPAGRGFESLSAHKMASRETGPEPQAAQKARAGHDGPRARGREDDAGRAGCTGNGGVGARGAGGKLNPRPDDRALGWR